MVTLIALICLLALLLFSCKPKGAPPNPIRLERQVGWKLSVQLPTHSLKRNQIEILTEKDFQDRGSSTGGILRVQGLWLLFANGSRKAGSQTSREEALNIDLGVEHGASRSKIYRRSNWWMSKGWNTRSAKRSGAAKAASDTLAKLGPLQG